MGSIAMYGYFFLPVYIKFPYLLTQNLTCIAVVVYYRSQNSMCLYFIHVSLVRNGHVQIKKRVAKSYLKCYAQHARMLNTRW